MTRITLLGIVAIMISTTVGNASFKSENATVLSTSIVSNETVQNQLPDLGTHHIPQPAALPAAAKPSSEHPKKSNSTKLEELAHIHHFHKERVKKIKRHHGKVWILSKLFLIVCHMLLLVAAYMHVTH